MSRYAAVLFAANILNNWLFNVSLRYAFMNRIIQRLFALGGTKEQLTFGSSNRRDF